MLHEIAIPIILFELGLKGNDLLVAGYIYSIGKLNQTKDVALSLDTIAKSVNSTRQGIIKNINSLINRGVITKSEGTVERLDNGGWISVPNTYHINF